MSGSRKESTEYKAIDEFEKELLVHYKEISKKQMELNTRKSSFPSETKEAFEGTIFEDSSSPGDEKKFEEANEAKTANLALVASAIERYFSSIRINEQQKLNALITLKSDITTASGNESMRPKTGTQNPAAKVIKWFGDKISPPTNTTQLINKVEKFVNDEYDKRPKPKFGF